MLQSPANSKRRKVGDLGEREIELVEKGHSPGKIYIGHVGECERDRSNAEKASRILRQPLDPGFREIQRIQWQGKYRLPIDTACSDDGQSRDIDIAQGTQVVHLFGAPNDHISATEALGITYACRPAPLRESIPSATSLAVNF